MRRLRLLFILVFAVIFQVAAYAQAELEVSVIERMYVGESFIEMPSYYFLIKLESAERTDSLLVDSGDKVHFADLKPGPVTLTISDYQKAVRIEKDPKTNKDITIQTDDINVGEFRFQTFCETFNLVNGKNVVLVERKPIPEEDENLLDAAVAIADSPLVTFKGDTLVYNTNLLSVGKTAYAKDFLKQLPGVEIQGGNIIVLGQNVTKTYVNGALVFGYDPMNAFDYLKGDQVTSIESYLEEDPEQTRDGIKRRRQRVLDIKTKNPIVEVVDFQARAYGGFDGAADQDGSHQKRYFAGAEGRFFSEQREIKAGVLLNNLGVSRFSYMAQPPQSLSGYTEAVSANIGYERRWNNKLSPDGVGFEYSFARTKSKSMKRALTERYEMNGIPGQEVENSSESDNHSKTHSVLTKLVLGGTKKFYVNWNNIINFSDISNSSIQSGYTQTAGSDKMLMHQESTTNKSSWNVNEVVMMALKLPRYSPSLSMIVDIGHTDMNSWDIDTTASSYVKRYLTKDAEDIPVNISGNLRVMSLVRKSNPNGNSLNISGVLSTQYTRQKSIQTAFDLYGVDTPVPNMTNTYDYTQSVFNNRLSLDFTRVRQVSVSTNSLVLTGSLGLSSDKVLDIGTIPASSVDKWYISFLPRLSIVFPLNLEKGVQNLSLNYSANNITPSVEQLRDRIDDSNPLNLIAGNPDLKQSHSHDLSLSYSLQQMPKRKSAFLQTNLSATLVTNPIARKLTYYASDAILQDYGDYKIPAGSTLNVSVNTAPSFSSSGSANFSDSYPMFKAKMRLKVTLEGAVDYSDRAQYYGENLDRTREVSPSLILRLQTNIKTFSLSTSARTRYTKAWNSESELVSNLSNTLMADASTHFWKYGVASVNYSLTNYNYFKGNYRDQTYHRLSASVGAELCKGQLQIHLSGSDLLNGGSTYSVQTSVSSVTQTWTPVYGRYFLLGVIWRINTSGGKMVIGL